MTKRPRVTHPYVHNRIEVLEYVRRALERPALGEREYALVRNGAHLGARLGCSACASARSDAEDCVRHVS